MQTNDVDLNKEILDISQSAPFILVIGTAMENTQYFICGENIAICESKSYLDAIIDLICTYYVFDIAYPKSLSGIFLFLQQSVFNIKDDQVPPACLLRVLQNITSLSAAE